MLEFLAYIVTLFGLGVILFVLIAMLIEEYKPMPHEKN